MESLKNYDRIHWEFTPKKGVTEKLVENLTSCDYGDIPPHVLELGKLLVLDSIGGMLSGARTPSGEKLKAFTDFQGGRKESTVAWYGTATHRYNAALLNGAFCQASGVDALSAGAMHCAAVVVSAALAVAEKEIREGIRLLSAVVLGWETMCRLHAAAGWVPDRRPLEPTSTFGPFGAAVAASKLLGFDAFELENALSLCPSQSAAAVRAVSEGSESGQFHGGFAASYGVRCAYLAREGLSGPREILEGNMGFFQCVSGLHDDDRTPRYNTDVVNERFGERWLLEDVSVQADRPTPSAGGTESASWQTVSEKFTRQADASGLSPSRRDRLVELVARIECLDDAGELLKLTRVRGQ